MRTTVKYSGPLGQDYTRLTRLAKNSCRFHLVAHLNVSGLVFCRIALPNLLVDFFSAVLTWRNVMLPRNIQSNKISCIATHFTCKGPGKIDEYIFYRFTTFFGDVNYFDERDSFSRLMTRSHRSAILVFTQLMTPPMGLTILGRDSLAPARNCKTVAPNAVGIIVASCIYSTTSHTILLKKYRLEKKGRPSV